MELDRLVEAFARVLIKVSEERFGEMTELRRELNQEVANMEARLSAAIRSMVPSSLERSVRNDDEMTELRRELDDARRLLAARKTVAEDRLGEMNDLRRALDQTHSTLAAREVELKKNQNEVANLEARLSVAIRSMVALTTRAEAL